MGTFFGAVLAQAGHTVHVVSKRANTVEEVALSSVGAARAHGTVRVRGAYPDERVGLVVVCTRSSQALEEARRAVEAVDDAGGVVLVQNGLTPLEVADAVGVDRVAPAVVGFNARLEDASRVRVVSKGPVTVGSLKGGTERAVGRFAEALDGVVPVKVSGNPRGAVWSKWCVSCAISGLAVVTGRGVGDVTRRRAGREAMVGLISECVGVANAEGVVLARVAGPLAPDTLAGSASSGLGGWFRRCVMWGIGRAYGSVTPSALRALRESRDPEVDRLNGVAVKRGDALGVQVPYNRAVASLAGEVVEGAREPALDALDEVQERVA